MKRFLLPLSLTALCATVQAAPFEQAKVTRVVNSVELLKPEAKPMTAAVGDDVTGRTAVQTGSDSRSELTFPDDTIARIGANALFRFQSGSRAMDLEQGTMLYSSPKGEGGGEVRMGAITAAVTGTNFLAGYDPKKEVKIIVLEGKVKVHDATNPGGTRTLRAGQMFRQSLDPDKPDTEVVNVNLNKLGSTSRLLEAGGFSTLKDAPLIRRAAQAQSKRHKSINNLPTQETQSAQVTRQTENQPPPPAAPVVKPDPVPQATPIPARKPPVIKPRPTPCPSPSPGGGHTDRAAKKSSKR